MANNNRKLVFITGATGFIGGRVAEQLCLKNWDVRALVRSIPKANAILDAWQPDTPHSIEFVQGDLFAGTPQERMELFRRCLKGATCLYHLAEAKTKEGDSDAKNIKTLGLLLEASRETETLERFVFVSAFMAGGLPQPLPAKLTEEVTGVEFPDSYYQWKRKGEKIVARMSADSRFSYAIIRPALVYGPHAEWLAPMLTLIRRAGKFIIPIPGRGSARLGTVHVEDVGDLIAASGWSANARNAIIHAVDDGETTYADWFREIARNAGWEVNIVSIPKGLVLFIGRGADTLTSIVGRRYGAHLWAQVLSEGCGYSNDRMKSIVGKLQYPTIREGMPGMMKWFTVSHP